ncbi:MAG TPA: ABC transporter permease [Pseudonocardiaceae bacterium]|nr:ABC transporter permease [Pseudonocardiaceae bacterium]
MTAPNLDVLTRPAGGEVQTRGGLWLTIGRAFTANRLAVLGVGLLVAIVLFCFLGPLVYHTDQVYTDLVAANLPPSAAHPLGTDYLGYDELGRLMVGGRSSIEVGLAAAVMASAFGVIWGAVAGYIGGVLDAVMMRIVDVVLSIPGLFILLFIATIIPPTLGTMIAIIALFSWLIPARLVRGEVLSLRSREYVQAVKVMGGRGPRIVLRHLIPNAIGVIVVQTTFEVANSILIFAVLSYLGFGLSAPAASWGEMLSTGTAYIYDGYWWQIYPPGVAILLIVLAFNFVGDALRDALDVRLRQP